MNEFYAYPEDKSGLEAVMRFHAVKRWHMIDTTRTQTLAEHSANVALLVWYIAATCPGMYFGPADGISAKALRHDLAEVFTGDIPSYTKPYVTGLNELEHAILPGMFQYETSLDEKALIKIADLADGIRFIRLHGVDITASHAQKGLQDKLTTMWADVSHWPTEVISHVVGSSGFYAFEKL